MWLLKYDGLFVVMMYDVDGGGREDLLWCVYVEFVVW